MNSVVGTRVDVSILDPSSDHIQVTPGTIGMYHMFIYLYCDIIHGRWYIHGRYIHDHCIYTATVYTRPLYIHGHCIYTVTVYTRSLYIYGHYIHGHCIYTVIV